MSVKRPPRSELPQPYLPTVAALAAHGSQHMPALKITEPDRMARTDVRILFYHGGRILAAIADR
jgi:hypothetical protein